ncbi:hypothetical protein ACFX14_012023 [Malus domestica]
MAVKDVSVFISCVVVVAGIVGPAVIGASGGCSSAAMRVKWEKGSESARRIRDLLVLDKHPCLNVHRWIRIIG